MNNRAVSPVIGVILMVAVTVILGAVVGMFVLDQTDSMKDSSPSIAFSYSLSPNGSVLTITHDGGDSLDADRISVVVNGTALNGTRTFNGTVRAGDSMTTDVNQGNTVRIVWTSPDGQTRILSRYEVG